MFATVVSDDVVNGLHEIRDVRFDLCPAKMHSNVICDELDLF
jgi:hypothetical protein